MTKMRLIHPALVLALLLHVASLGVHVNSDAPPVSGGATGKNKGDFEAAEALEASNALETAKQAHEGAKSKAATASQLLKAAKVKMVEKRDTLSKAMRTDGQAVAIRESREASRAYEAAWEANEKAKKEVTAASETVSTTKEKVKTKEKKEESTLDANSSPNGRHTTEVDTAQRTSPATSDKDVQLNPKSPEGDQVQKEGNKELSGTVDHKPAETKNTQPQDISLPKAQNGHGLQTGDEAQGKGPKPNAINTPKVTDGHNSPDVSTAAGVAGDKQVTQETQEKRAEEKSVQSPATGTAASNPDTSTDRGTAQTPDATPKEAAIHLIPVTPLGGQKGEGKPTDSANTRAIGTDNKGKDTTVHVKGTKAKGDTTEKGDGTKGTSQTHVVPTDGTSTGKNPSAPKTDALTNKGGRPATVGRVPPKVSVTVPPMPDVNKTTIL
eukprot:Tbor_TRINITY_DN5786_c0_g1::TRINITY_DN5786_c0_g1_i8::g.20936::m.20936